VTGLSLLEELGHEELVLVRDHTAGLRAVVAIHDTTLGPAVGGTRMRLYPSLDEAAADALRLSRAMTYKTAMAGMSWGGGKAVIVADPARDKTPALWAAYAEALNRIGRFHTGPDMGLDGGDCAALARLTKFMTHVPGGSKGDAAALTALGVFEAIRAVAEALGLPLAGLHVALQGLGKVGGRLAERLAAAGVRLTVSDVDPARVERAVSELGAAAASPEAIYDVPADVFSPNAAGGVLSAATVPRLRCRAVAGGANDQLASLEAADALEARGILLAPDYLVNAGGVLTLLLELGETDEAGLMGRVRAIGPRLFDLLRQAREEGRSPYRVADAVVERILAAGRARRRAGC
jgi:leucine dehydrogenase